jgi:predicted molibdopterin-dependent oxidoreductase YjgC
MVPEAEQVSGAQATQRATMLVDGQPVVAPVGISVAAALLSSGRLVLRHSPTDDAPRGAFCLMGVCQECTVMIDGRAERACMTAVRDGLSISLRGPHAA